MSGDLFARIADRRRVIDVLREKFPGRWSFEAPNVWRHETGWHVYACATLAPRFDGDDDSFVSQLRRSDTGETLRTAGMWL